MCQHRPSLSAAELPSCPGRRLLILGVAEPFRLFMPLGLLAGIFGVAVWPLVLTDHWWLDVAPVAVHWRALVEGFFGLFIVGFLGTAGPRLLGAPPLTKPEVAVLLVWTAGLLGTLACGQVGLTDGFFVLLLGTTMMLLLVRFVIRREMPPPGFVLVGLGLLGSVGAAAILALGALAPLPASLMRVAQLWLSELMPLLPILGVGAFLFPRFLGRASRHDLDTGRDPVAPWGRLAAEALGLGALAVAGLLVEVLAGAVRLGVGLRLLAVVLFVARDFPLWRWRPAHGGVSLALVIGVLGIVGGLALRVVLPTSGINGAHLFYIGGAALVTLAVGTRVCFGHSGQAHLLKRPAPAIGALAGLLLGAALLRLWPLWEPLRTPQAWMAAAVACLAGLALWALRVIPAVVRPDDED